MGVMVGKSKLFELLILGLWLLIVLILYLKVQQTNQKTPFFKENENSQITAGNKSYDVKRVTVNSGCVFDIMIDDVLLSRIMGRLSVKTATEAKKKVIDLLNNCTKPRIVLKNKDADGIWVLDLYLTIDGSELNLTNWLKDNKLVYN
jgi:hypothetical protein